MNKYYENTVCDRLAEAVEHAAKKRGVNIKLEVAPLGISIRMRRDIYSMNNTVSYLDLSEAKINVLPLHIDKMYEELVNETKAAS